MKELDLPPEEHLVQIDTYDYGEHHMIALKCACNAWWTIPQPKGESLEQAVARSIQYHIGSLKRPPTKPD